MHVRSLFIRTCLAWFIIFLAPPLETSATQETKLKSQRYDADGIQLSQAKHWKEASDEFRKAVQVDPKHKLAHANLGVTLSRLGNHKEALLAFDEAIKLGYDHVLLRYNSGLSLDKLILIEASVKELILSLNMNYRNVSADYNLALLYL